LADGATGLAHHDRTGKRRRNDKKTTAELAQLLRGLRLCFT
jgi:hypothetical protein